METWIINMIVLYAISFGFFFYGIRAKLKALEKRRNTSKSCMKE
jgi:hypothetical protein